MLHILKLLICLCTGLFMSGLIYSSTSNFHKSIRAGTFFHTILPYSLIFVFSALAEFPWCSNQVSGKKIVICLSESYLLVIICSQWNILDTALPRFWPQRSQAHYDLRLAQLNEDSGGESATSVNIEHLLGNFGGRFSCSILHWRENPPNGAEDSWCRASSTVEYREHMQYPVSHNGKEIFKKRCVSMCVYIYILICIFVNIYIYIWTTLLYSRN